MLERCNRCGGTAHRDHAYVCRGKAVGYQEKIQKLMGWRPRRSDPHTPAFQVGNRTDLPQHCGRNDQRQGRPRVHHEKTADLASLGCHLIASSGRATRTSRTAGPELRWLHPNEARAINENQSEHTAIGRDTNFLSDPTVRGIVSLLFRSPDIAYVPRKIPKLEKGDLMTTSTQTGPSTDSPRATLLNLIRGFRVSQMISVAAKLRIADLLAEGPKTVTQLARATSCHEDSLYRLLRALASIGVFAEEDGLSFCLSPCAELLQSEVSGSLRTNAEVVGEEWMWLPWGSLLHSVKTGESACEHVYGKNTWDWFTENPSAGQLFDQFMDESTVGSAASVLAAYDFLAPRTVIDIAGGRGVLLASILRRNLAARGVLFNLPQVIEAAGKFLD